MNIPDADLRDETLHNICSEINDLYVGLGLGAIELRQEHIDTIREQQDKLGRVIQMAQGE